MSVRVLLGRLRRPAVLPPPYPPFVHQNARMASGEPVFNAWAMGFGVMVPERPEHLEALPARRQPAARDRFVQGVTVVGAEFIGHGRAPRGLGGSSKVRSSADP